MPQRWAGKTTAHRLWIDINKYVDAYVSEHQSKLESEWFRRWYNAFNNASLEEESNPIELASFVLVQKPDATVIEIIRSLYKWIPKLEDFIILHQIGEKNGNVRYSMKPYGFQTPIKATPQQPTEKEKAKAGHTDTCVCRVSP